MKKFQKLIKEYKIDNKNKSIKFILEKTHQKLFDKLNNYLSNIENIEHKKYIINENLVNYNLDSIRNPVYLFNPIPIYVHLLKKQKLSGSLGKSLHFPERLKSFSLDEQTSPMRPLQKVKKGFEVNSFNIDNWKINLINLKNNKYNIEFEYIGEPDNLSEDSIDFISNIIKDKLSDDDIYQQELYNLANLILGVNYNSIKKFNKQITLKDILNNAKVFTKIKYIEDIFPTDGYFVHPKIKNGKRVIIIADNNGCRYVSYDKVKNLTDVNLPNKLYIAEGELYENKIYLYDILYLDGDSLLNRKFKNRILKVDNFIETINDFIKGNIKLDKQKIIQLNKSLLKRQFNQIYNFDYIYSVDGLIIKHPDGDYNDDRNYKWKENNTIDFLVRTYEDKNYLFNFISTEIYDKYSKTDLPFYYELFSKNIKNKIMFPTHFTPIDYPEAYKYDSNGENLNKKYVELEWLPVNEKWNFVGFKYDANTYLDAIDNWQLYKDPIELKDLYLPILDTKYESSNYYQFLNFKNYCEKFINIFYARKTDGLVDISNAFLQKRNMKIYAEENLVNNYIFINRFGKALGELTRYRLELIKKYKKFASVDISMLSLNILDSLEDSLFLYGKDFKTMRINTIIINNNISQFMNSRDGLQELVKFCKGILQPDGVIIITCMNGNKIFKLIGDDDFWKSGDENILTKYEIIKDYKSDYITAFGQKVQIKKIGSQTDYEEKYLVNINSVISEFNMEKFGLIKRGSFALHYQEYIKHLQGDENVSNLFDIKSKYLVEDKYFTSDDKLYLSLYEFLIFKNNN